jgi:TonB-linked SusC/RagA family outer membrane protein
LEKFEGELVLSEIPNLYTMKKNLLCYLWVVGLLLIQGSVFAQTRVVTGTVVTVDNTPLPGVTVALKGKSSGTVTDTDGKFSVNAEASDVLVFSFIGFETHEQQVGDASTISVSLTESIKSLQEIVVVGYGEQKKTSLTGAVATVDPKVLESRPIADAGRGLQGITPGLNIVIPSGEVGSDPLMKIRGQINSLTGSSAPLILLDNVEIPSIQLVNPNDIESISVLKDAASASIYGAKAAGGVILITTKKGAKAEGVTVSYSGNMSFSNMSKEMKMGTIDAMEYTLLGMQRTGATVAGAFWYVTQEGYDRAVQWQTDWADKVKPNDPMLYGRDWFVDANNRKIGLRMYDPYDYMIKEWTPTQLHNLSLSGKSGKTTYNFGFGFLDQTGLIKPADRDDFQRYNGSLQVTTEVNDWLKFNVGAIYSKRNKNYPYATNSTTADPWLYLYRWATTYPMTTEDGEPIRSPYWEMKNSNTANQETNYTNFNGGFLITPKKDWTIKFDYAHATEDFFNKRPGTRFTGRDSWSAAIAKNDANGNRIYVNSAGEEVASTDPGAMAAWQLPQTTYTAVGSNPDHVYRYAMNNQRNTINLYSTYDLSLNEKHNLKFMLGMNRVGYKASSQELQIAQLVDYENPQFSFATGTISTPGFYNANVYGNIYGSVPTVGAGGGEYWESQLGFFGRINYNFNEKYLFEANLRHDGTSKFPDNLKWRWYPSFSAGWRVNEEAFMDWSSNYLDEFKIRASWGTIGNQAVSNDLYVPTMGGTLNSWINGTTRLFQFGTPGAVTNSVTWEDITTFDIGTDIKLLNNKLGVTFDWFQRDTQNMLVPQEGFPLTFGTGAPRGNFGALRTKGVELQLTYAHELSNGLRFSVTASVADAVTKITKYGTTQSIDNWYVGKTYGEIWGYETDRLFQAEDFVYDGAGLLISTVIDGFTVNQMSDENGAHQGKLQAGTFRFGPGDVKYKDLNGDGAVNDGNRLTYDHGDLKIIGNSTPRYEYSFRLNADFKGIDFGIFFQGIAKRQIWGDGFLTTPGYNSSDGAMPQAIAGDFWKADRTDAFYPRPWNMGLTAGGSASLNMQPQTRYLLNMAYLRIKNITLGYTLPATLSQKVHLTKVRVYGSLENFFTFDHLGDLPVDPEVISGYSMWNTSNYNSGRTGVGVPAFKTASMGVQLSF